MTPLTHCSFFPQTKSTLNIETKNTSQKLKTLAVLHLMIFPGKHIRTHPVSRTHGKSSPAFMCVLEMVPPENLFCRLLSRGLFPLRACLWSTSIFNVCVLIQISTSELQESHEGPRAAFHSLLRDPRFHTPSFLVPSVSVMAPSPCISPLANSPS